MPAVFVHGVPETAALWAPLRSHLDRDDHLALSLPGFGCPLPDGFDTSKEGYADWLVAELRAIGEPVDLVGHDWGGGLTAWVATTHPELLRSWVCDALYVFDARFRWHKWAHRWQTPEVGEEDVRATLAADLDDRAAVYAHWGVPRDDARTFASWFDATMGQAILGLYRSAVDVQDEWGGRFRPGAPGLALLAEDEQFSDPSLVEAVAARHDLPVERLAGVGHWWMLQRPQHGAAVLERFWASVDG